MAAKVPALGERFVTFGALEWSYTGMFPEMIPQIAAFLEDAVATFVFALEE